MAIFNKFLDKHTLFKQEEVKINFWFFSARQRGGRTKSDHRFLLFICSSLNFLD